MDQNRLTEEQINKVLQGVSIPPQPQILVDIQMEQVMPHPDLRRIAHLISQDVGLSGLVLKVVNSPYFGLRNKISSIQQAVSLLGLSTVVNILNGISIRSELSDAAIVALGRFWDSAMDVASVSASIAKQVGFKNPDEMYALGLFHNCGIPLLMRRFPDYMTVMESSYNGRCERIIDMENQHYNTNHAVVGFYVARSWGLPTAVCEVIAEHHNASMVFNSGTDFHYDSHKKTMLAIIKAAEHMCRLYHVLGRQANDYEWESVVVPLLIHLGLSQDAFDDMRDSFTELGLVGESMSYLD